MKLNNGYKAVKNSYLFTEIGRRVADFSAKNPNKKIIRLGIGDVTRPLVPAIVDAMEKAVLEMGNPETFRGYGDEQGYAFLRESIATYYADRKINIAVDEIFISDGAKSDLGNVLDLFSSGNNVAIPSPVYPVYVDTNLMSENNIILLDGNPENGFLPAPMHNQKVDIIYICSPNNPTGAVYTKEQLTEWVSYALDNNAIILFDAAYEAFISDPELPRSIFEIDGARRCAIEFCSLSKTAGFTGTRCGYTIVPHELVIDDMSIRSMWLRRQTTKFNGVSYIVQRGAQAVFTTDGLRQTAENIAYYKQNASMMNDTLTSLGIQHWGGIHSPYVWLRCPNNQTSFEFFDTLLEKAGIVGTPGAGFGENGEGFFRLTAFGTHENTELAMQKLQEMFK